MPSHAHGRHENIQRVQRHSSSHPDALTIILGEQDGHAFYRRTEETKFKKETFLDKLYKHVQAHERGNESLLRVIVSEQVS